MGARMVVAGVLGSSGSWVAVHLPTPAEVWEVDDAAGHVVYRGRDLTLAEELYGADPSGQHLFPVGFQAGAGVAR